MTVSITPIAVDAMVSIESIRVVGRHRSDLGDIRSLAASIEDLGMLLHPIVLTVDSRLVAGQRRLEACRRLGWDTVPVRFAHSLDDASKLLRAERDENCERMDMRPSELASLGAALEQIEAERARARQRVHAGTAPGRGGNTEGTGTPSVENHSGKTTSVVGEALGMAGRTYQELAFVHRIATDTESTDDERALAEAALAEMDRTGSIAPPARRLRGALRAKSEAQAVKAAVMSPPSPPASQEDPEWVPAPTERGPKPAKRRRELMAEMADRRCTSHQIGERLGIDPVTVRRIARDEGIAIPADELLGARTRKTIDSNRFVRETVHQIEGFVSGLDLIRFDELDPTEIEDWTASLTESIRVLNRLNKRLKERVQ